MDEFNSLNLEKSFKLADSDSKSLVEIYDQIVSLYTLFEIVLIVIVLLLMTFLGWQEGQRRQSDYFALYIQGLSKKKIFAFIFMEKACLFLLCFIIMGVLVLAHFIDFAPIAFVWIAVPLLLQLFMNVYWVFSKKQTMNALRGKEMMD